MFGSEHSRTQPFWLGSGSIVRIRTFGHAAPHLGPDATPGVTSRESAIEPNVDHSMQLSTATAAHAARSEDRVVTRERDEVVAIVLADGAGGRSGGAEAADAFVDAAALWLERSRDWFDFRALAKVFIDVDGQLHDGETTGVVVVVAPYALCGVSAGDSEAWMITERAIDRLTAKQDRMRVGSSRVRPVVFHRKALEGTLVVATDGLFRHADASAIARSCARAEDLVVLPRLVSGAYPDDVAVAVVR